MKGLKLSLVIMAAALVTLALSGYAFAFHSGGVAECEGCHSMHAPRAGGTNLLVGIDNSSTCLTCHQNAADTGPSSYHVSTADSSLTGTSSPLQRSPGGDFGWIKKSYTYTYTSGGQTITETELGQTHGHNIIAADFGYTVDTRNTTAPGGSYLSSNLGCASCHDPHGRGRRLSDGTYTVPTIGVNTAPIIGSGSYNNSPIPAAGEAVGLYRLLASPQYTSGGVNFTSYPIAVAPSTYNRRETSATTQVRVAYGHVGQNTWGNWCATCHASMHSANGYSHPVDDDLGADIANFYNAYVKSGDLSGTSATAYLSLVPFAENTGDFTVLASHANPTSVVLNGPASSDRVMCLSCHRAHASGFLHGLRFDQGYEFMTKGGQYIGSDNPLVTGSRAPLQHRGRTNAQWEAAYYDRPATTWASYQRVLCNKCHARD